MEDMLEKMWELRHCVSHIKEIMFHQLLKHLLTNITMVSTSNSCTPYINNIHLYIHR